MSLVNASLQVLQVAGADPSTYYLTMQPLVGTSSSYQYAGTQLTYAPLTGNLATPRLTVTNGIFWANGAAWSSGSTSSSGSIQYTANTVPPSSATVGSQWFNTTTNQLFEYTYDGLGYYWVDISGPTSTIYASNGSTYTLTTITSFGSNGNTVVSGNLTVNGNVYANNIGVSVAQGVSVAGISTFTSNNVADFLGNVGFSTTTPQASLDLSQRTDAVILPIGTTSQRPTTSNGAVRYNTTANTVECFMSNGVSNNWSTMAGGPTFSVYATAGQSITGATATQISLQNKIFDTANCFNNTGSTATLNGLSVPAYAFMPPVPGYYQFNFSARQSSTSAEIVVFVYKNGVGAVGQGVDLLSGYAATGSHLVFMNGTTDYIQLYIYTGASITLVSRTQAIGSTTYGMDTYLQGFLARGI
jgi:hypothetical protein